MSGGRNLEFHRFAVYFVPPPGALAEFGAAWLGRDLRRGAAAPQPRLAGLDLAALTAAPRRYGFHATLKAPFRPLAGVDGRALVAGLRQVARGMAPVRLSGGLRLAQPGGFLALAPAQDSAELQALAARLVRGMDPFRAPLTPEDRARRRPETLTPRQRAHLDRWGYPWIFADFRFHMTLTGPVADPAPVIAALTPQLPTDLDDDLTIAQVSLVGEDAAGLFHWIADAPLRG